MKDSSLINLKDFFSSIVRDSDELLDRHLVDTGSMSETLWFTTGLDNGCNGIDPYLAGYLHDIGKLSMSSRLVWKPAKLSENEWILMREHPERSANYIMKFVSKMGIESLLPYVEIVLCHHEKPDGSGYPRKLHNYKIPLMSKIVSIADMFSALTSYRQYRVEKPLYSKEEAVLIIEKEWRKGFDDETFDKIRDILLSNL